MGNTYNKDYYIGENPSECSMENQKQIKTIDLTDLKINVARKTFISEVTEPKPREKGELVKTVDQLISHLKESGVKNQ